jgi:hypothetical protein
MSVRWSSINLAKFNLAELPEKCVGPESDTGGGGCRFRAHILDSESGGAKGHYPNYRTRKAENGSGLSVKKLLG